MTLPNILERVKKKGYKVFTSGDYNVNIIGVRTANRISNSFDDFLYIVFKVKGEWINLCFPITTDPGLYHLQNPAYVVGTAIMYPKQYRGVYKLGKHRGQYEALVQTGGKVKIYRDKNKDEVLDHDPENMAVGYFGLNIHRSSKHNSGSKKVEKWSAGCQVFQNPKDYDIFIAICKKAAAVWGNSFTYTLLED